VSNYKYIDIRDAGMSDSGKTRRWEVFEKQDGVMLGRISWLSSWRCYVFQPCWPTMYEQQCMRDIADFIESQTLAHKKGRHAETDTRTGT
jgi:hypothetical protein